MQKAAAGALSPSVAVPSLVRPLGEGRAGATETVIEAEAGPLGPRVSFLFQREEKSNGEWNDVDVDLDLDLDLLKNSTKKLAAAPAASPRRAPVSTRSVD